MNRLRLLVCLLFICLAVKLPAQTVTYSPYDGFDFQNGDFAVVGMTAGHLYTFHSSTKGFFLDAYNDSMTKTATVLLDFFPEKIYETRFIAYPDKIIALYQSIESNKVVQYAALLDDAGRLKKGPLKLDEAKTGIFGPSRNYFSSAMSEDKRTIVVYSANSKGDEISFQGKWIDDELNVTKRSHATFKADNAVEHGEVSVANNGTVYMAALTPAGAQNYADEMWVLSLPAGGLKFDSKELPLDNMYATSAYMKIDNANNRIYIGGFYADKRNGNYSGLLYAYYDINTASFQNRKLLAFDPEMLNASGVKKNKRRAFDNFQVRQLIVKNDGGFVLVSESFYITTRSSYTPGFGYYSSYYSPFSSSLIREYHYNDVLALSYDANGNREWGAFIPKEQYSQEDGGLFSSYALLNTGGTLAFMYNDFNTSHSRIQLATLDAQGKLAMNSFTAEGNDYPDWLPRSGKQVAGRVIVVPCLRKKQICFAKVVF